ncbi:coproporphyrinogen dehydrogenase HemZ [Heliophilum fasciatum]|uniref:coproporphyrinogen dehydrogenase HemZ n=1 Tax=Heliophilum fasciatum TaxID=35700 RepID=UPI00140477F0|nr:coproporphyrinogen dehydrogenase HemZ [Heliophilum fasciatum]MCW2278056.1 oxygen-independent coproporphyrinogen-3 oxidase [Heliophilum fasciatum]
MQEILWLFLPDGRFVSPEQPAQVVVTVQEENPGETIMVTVADGTHIGTGSAEPGQVHDEQKDNHRRRLIKLAFLRALVQCYGAVPGEWGILTGVRPTKIVHRALDQGQSVETIDRLLQEAYAVAPAKADLLLQVAQRQRLLFAKSTAQPQAVGIYIAIPFCPTRCLYCSFPGYDLSKHHRWVEPVLAGLEREIAAVGAALARTGRTVQHIYIGGGTPTVLTSEQLARLLGQVNEALRSEATVEVTVEAGRPDTLDEAKMAVMQAHQVTRVSINPQTMEETTLQRIGRHHTAEQIKQAVAMVRQAGIPVLNMDVILGLPGETAATVAFTMAEIAKLRPENITVHTLAIKRASRLTMEKAEWHFPEADEVTAMARVCQDAVASMQLEPYYLYRQKRMLGNLENVGYALPGQECLYNVMMMEERQTIWGLGVGAASKWIDPSSGELTENRYNPKDPLEYIKRLDEMIQRKVAQMEEA